jgi:branched-chain amino acid transport system ATP-binding protein
VTALLECREVSKSFGGVHAVGEVSFTIESGDLMAIIGPNGAGKTTLLNLMSGLTRPDSGRITLSDRTIVYGAPWRNVHTGIARTLQTPVVFPGLTVLQNVMLGHVGRKRVSFLASTFGAPAVRAWRGVAHDKAVGILERVGLTDVAERQATELSLGLQRIVELGRALATEPRLLLLDEPASGLAHAEVDHLQALLADVARSEVTVCLVEHNMRMVMALASRVVVLNHGRLLMHGSPLEVREHPEVVAAYLGTRRAHV